MRTWMVVAWPVLTAGLGVSLGVMLGVAVASRIASAQERHAGAHEHGRGTLNIAIEGNRLSMELEAPGVDIVGFEHDAETDKDKDAIKTAKRQLGAPLELFSLPAAAGCVLTIAEINLEGDEHDAEEHAGKDGAAEGGAHGHGHEHTGFRAEYDFDCQAPERLTGIGFDYFKAFAGAEKLDVTIITAKGQSKYEVSRAKPHLDLGGAM